MRPTTREVPEPGAQEGPKGILAERERIARLSRVRELVSGSLDGLIVPLGVVSGVAGGTGDSSVVVVAGIAEAFAGAQSMGAGEFIAARSEAQVQRHEVDEMNTAPEYEKRELAEAGTNEPGDQHCRDRRRRRGVGRRWLHPRHADSAPVGVLS